MSEVINFNKARKAKVKSLAKAKANENSVKFGRTKAQKDLEKAQADQNATRLDGKKQDPC